VPKVKSIYRCGAGDAEGVGPLKPRAAEEYTQIRFFHSAETKRPGSLQWAFAFRRSMAYDAHERSTTEASMLHCRSLLIVLLGSLLVFSTTADAFQAPTLTPQVYLPFIYQMTRDPCDTTFPLIPLQPSQTRLAFIRQDITGNNLYLINAGSTTSESLTQSAGVSDLEWSPDGTQIAFLSSSTITTSLILLRLDDNRMTTVMSWEQSSERLIYPRGITWSPDGQQIAFALVIRAISDIERVNIMVMQSDGSGLRQLTHSDADTDPAWSPDGKLIAYRSYGIVLMRMQPDGSSQTQITDRWATAGPVWTPDGSRIGFVSGCGSRPGGFLYTIRPDGTGLTVLLRLPGTLTSWSPDGTRVAYTAQRFKGSDIFVTNLDGSGFSQIDAQYATALTAKWAPR
jgi:Tol biopolymer transport system component